MVVLLQFLTLYMCPFAATYLGKCGSIKARKGREMKRNCQLLMLTLGSEVVHEAADQRHAIQQWL